MSGELKNFIEAMAETGAVKASIGANGGLVASPIGPQEFFKQPDEQLIGHDGKTWPQTFDAYVWAKEFVARNPDADLDAMLGWFANAIMLGYDTYRWRHCGEAKEKLAKFGAMVLKEILIKDYIEWDLVEFEVWGLISGLLNEESNLSEDIKEVVEELLK